jgi:hypothetical protein
LGASEKRHVKHIHQFMLHEMLLFNASHHIHFFRFGENYPQMESPLEQVKGVVEQGKQKRNKHNEQYYQSLYIYIFTSSEYTIIFCH